MAPPYSLIGDAAWTDISADIDVSFDNAAAERGDGAPPAPLPAVTAPPTYARLCVRSNYLRKPTPYGSGFCLPTNSDGSWAVNIKAASLANLSRKGSAHTGLTQRCGKT